MDLSDRMKLYENLGVAGQMLIPNLPVCVRIDGKAFHSWTRGCERPFDARLQMLFDETTKALIEETDAIIGYTQSDEITLILWNRGNSESKVYFDGRVSKLTSVLASMATAHFNARVPLLMREKADSLAFFDCRVWNVPTPQEAVNCLIWRELDATRNSISMAAQSLYSHKQLHAKNTSAMQELIWQKGINWNDYPSRFKRGGYFRRQVIKRKFSTSELEALPPQHDARKDPDLIIIRQIIGRVEFPPLLKITNRVEVIFDSAEPILATEVSEKTA